MVWFKIEYLVCDRPTRNSNWVKKVFFFSKILESDWFGNIPKVPCLVLRHDIPFGICQFYRFYRIWSIMWKMSITFWIHVHLSLSEHFQSEEGLRARGRHRLVHGNGPREALQGGCRRRPDRLHLRLPHRRQLCPGKTRWPILLRPSESTSFFHFR